MADVVTKQEVKDYLSIDYDDRRTDQTLTRLISTADKYLQGAIGTNYPKDDPRVKELALMMIADLYDPTGSSDKVSNNIKRFIDSSLLQIRLDLITITNEEA